MRGTEMMARPKAKSDPSNPDVRNTIINLKGSDAQSAWLEAIHRKTHIPKTVIVRLALELWAAKNGHPPFPS